MSDPQPHDSIRLDRIPTQWSLVRRAHTLSTPDAGEARKALVLRYAGAIRRYVGAVMRNDADADEVAQEVVVRMLRGDFHGADPERGRFRDLLKTAARNMVRDHWERQNRRRGVEYDLDHWAFIMWMETSKAYRVDIGELESVKDSILIVSRQLETKWLRDRVLRMRASRAVTRTRRTA